MLSALRQYSTAMGLAGALLGLGALALVLAELCGSKTAPAAWVVHAPERQVVLAEQAGMPARPWTWTVDPQVELRGPPASTLVAALRLAPQGRVRVGLGRELVSIGTDGTVTVGDRPCGPRTPGGRALLVRAAAGRLIVEQGGASRDCLLGGSDGAGGAVRIEAALGRVQVGRLVVDGRPIPGPLGSAWPNGVLFIGALTGAALLGLRASRWLSPRRLLLLLPPILLGLALVGVDPAAVAARLRVPALASPWLPAQVGLGGFVLSLALLLAWPSLGPGARVHRKLSAHILLGLAVAGQGAALGSRDGLSLLLLAVTGCCLAGLLLVNRHAATLPRFNVWSLGLLALGLAALDLSVGRSQAAESWAAAKDWNAVFARVSDDLPGATAADFADLEAAHPTRYPVRGYPVAFPAHGERPRIVCLGGSSTGGAWQMNDLARFYPARLERFLENRPNGAVEVINQGVGGWTSFHIRRYFHARHADLAAQILTLYIGHNDAGRGYPVPISTLYQGWRSRGHSSRRWSALWLWATVLSSASRGGGIAVPVDESRENLAAIIADAHHDGARVLLIGEATLGLEADLRPYHRMMEHLAETQADVAWLDGQAVLEGQPHAFIDRVHLTDAGHEALAAALAERLRELDWLGLNGR